MTYEDLTKDRARNDYTADKCKKTEIPEELRHPKSAICISSYSPGIELDLKRKQRLRN